MRDAGNVNGTSEASVSVLLYGTWFNQDRGFYELVVEHLRCNSWVEEEAAARTSSPLLTRLGFITQHKQAAVVALLASHQCTPVLLSGEPARIRAPVAVRVRIPARLFELLTRLEKVRGDLEVDELEKILKNPSAETLEAVLAVRKLTS